MPSPNVLPAPPPIVLLPWKKRPLLLMTPSAVRVIVSFDTLALPPALRTPPPPVPLAQPAPGPPLLRHGQLVPVPSPKQIGVPVLGPPVLSTRVSQFAGNPIAAMFSGATSLAVRF